LKWPENIPSVQRACSDVSKDQRYGKERKECELNSLSECTV